MEIPIDFRTHVNSLDQSGHHQGWYKNLPNVMKNFVGTIITIK